MDYRFLFYEYILIVEIGYNIDGVLKVIMN